MTPSPCSETPPACDVVIVNWNAGDQLTECLMSLAISERDDWNFGQVVIVDNGSSDGSMEAAWRAAGTALPLHLLKNDSNRGFAAACNQGAVGGTGEYLLFLNPDARPEPSALSGAIHVLESTPDAGVCGVRLVDANGKVHHTCARRPTPRHFANQMLGLSRIAPRRFPGPILEEWDHGATRDVEHVMGAFYLIRRALFECLGGFDERFFVYLEDLDLSVRVQDAGFRILYLADAYAYHKGGGTSERVKATRLFYSLRSRILYGCKHFGALPAALLLLGTLLLEPPIRVAAALARGHVAEAADAVRGAAMLWADLPHLLVASG